MTTFTETSADPYDQNEYKLVFKNGKSITFPDYETTKKYWWMYMSSGSLSHVEVVEKGKKSVVKGF
jgi:hypothetical protein